MARPMLRAGYIVLGAPLHAALLLLPALIAGHLATTLARPEVLVFLLLATAFFLADLPTVDPATPRADRPDGRTSVLALATGLLLLLIFWAGLGTASRPERPDHLARLVLGSALMVAGISLRFAAILVLGPRFRTELSGPGRLHRDGVYGRLRHPSEAGNLLVALGGAVALGSDLALGLTCLVLLPTIGLRVRREDAALRAQHGPEFVAYARQVGGLWPLFSWQRGDEPGEIGHAGRVDLPAPDPVAAGRAPDREPVGTQRRQSADGGRVEAARQGDEPAGGVDRPDPIAPGQIHG